MELSYSQGILLLIDFYRNENNLLNQLIPIYVLGCQNEQERSLIDELFTKAGLHHTYRLTTTIDKINNDATRRYFETHLSLEMLYQELSHIELESVLSHYQSAYLIMTQEQRSTFDAFCNGTMHPFNDAQAREYLDAINRVNNADAYKELSKTDKDKIILFLKCSWIGVIVGQKMPINIYGQGLFTTEARGRTTKEAPLPITHPYIAAQAPYTTCHYGLLKSYMPVPRNDSCYTKQGFSFVKPADGNHCNETAEWSQINFKSLVHPFSCGISGTMLAQLRLMKHLQNQQQLTLTDENTFKAYLKCFVAALLFNSGGHSYNEFLHVLTLEPIRENFKFLDWFKNIDMQSLLVKGNHQALSNALDKTIAYQKTILAKRHFHDKLVKHDYQLQHVTKKC